MNYIKLLSAKLCKKYNTTLVNYKWNIIDGAIKNKACKFTFLVKEAAYDSFIEEYLKRYYTISESLNRIPQMIQFFTKYQSLFNVPIFRHENINNIIHQYSTKKAEIYYRAHYDKKISSKRDYETVLTEEIKRKLDAESSEENEEDESIKSILNLIDPVIAKVEKNNFFDLERNTENAASTVDKTKADSKGKSRNRNIMHLITDQKTANLLKTYQPKFSLMKTTQLQIKNVISKIKKELNLNNIRTTKHKAKISNNVHVVKKAQEPFKSIRLSSPNKLISQVKQKKPSQKKFILTTSKKSNSLNKSQPKSTTKSSTNYKPNTKQRPKPKQSQALITSYLKQANMKNQKFCKEASRKSQIKLLKYSNDSYTYLKTQGNSCNRLTIGLTMSKGSDEDFGRKSCKKKINVSKEKLIRKDVLQKNLHQKNKNTFSYENFKFSFKNMKIGK